MGFLFKLLLLLAVAIATAHKNTSTVRSGVWDSSLLLGKPQRRGRTCVPKRKALVYSVSHSLKDPKDLCCHSYIAMDTHRSMETGSILGHGGGGFI